jgi:hypothetical protein
MHKAVGSSNLSHSTFSWLYRSEERQTGYGNVPSSVVGAPIFFIQTILQFWKKTTVYSCLKEIRGFYSLQADPSFELMVDHSPVVHQWRHLCSRCRDGRHKSDRLRYLDMHQPLYPRVTPPAVMFSSVGCLVFCSDHIALSDGTIRSVFQCP